MPEGKFVPLSQVCATGNVDDGGIGNSSTAWQVCALHAMCLSVKMDCLIRTVIMRLAVKRTTFEHICLWHHGRERRLQGVSSGSEKSTRDELVPVHGYWLHDGG
jgi:hypothetical protein